MKQQFMSTTPESPYSSVENIPSATSPIPSQYLRLPRAGTQDPIFGLSRSTWNNLILRCKANGGKPPIRSVSLKQRTAVRGVRLIIVASAIEYFEKLEREQSQTETLEHDTHGSEMPNDFSI